MSSLYDLSNAKIQFYHHFMDQLIRESGAGGFVSVPSKNGLDFAVSVFSDTFHYRNTQTYLKRELVSAIHGEVWALTHCKNRLGHDE